MSIKLKEISVASLMSLVAAVAYAAAVYVAVVHDVGEHEIPIFIALNGLAQVPVFLFRRRRPAFCVGFLVCSIVSATSFLWAVVNIRG